MEPIEKEKKVWELFNPEGQIKKLIDKYAKETHLCAVGYDLEINKYDASFDYPYRKYFFETPEEFIKICEIEKNGNINNSKKATKKKI